MLDALDRGGVARTELSAEHVQRLRASTDPLIESRVGTLFGPPRAGSRQEVVNQFLPALALASDAGRGRKVYEQRCAGCHRVAGAGRAIGPDFESVRSMGKEKLLTNILDPNREVAPAYLAYNAETRSGDSVTGLLLAEGAEAVTLRTTDGLEVKLSRSQIKTLSPSGISLMPEGLEQGMSPQELADLLEFISSGR